jgi:hypothetical protein
MKNILTIFVLFLLGVNFSFAQEEVLRPTADLPVYFDISPPLRDMIQLPPVRLDNSWKGVAVKNYFNTKIGQGQLPANPDFTDQGLQSELGPLTTDTTLQNFNGLGNVNGGVPPDTDGDVGPNHYFQVVNTSFAIYNKTGSKLMGPTASNSIWSGMPNNVNSGDAIILYDEQADRWIFSQFSLPNGTTHYMMIAVSQTPDPMGSWYRYQYSFAQLPDYPKFGVWPDGYYMTCNRFNISTGQFAGVGAYAYDRAAMLAGSPTATRISFTLSSGAEAFGVLPSDCDGTFPAAGTPNYFTYVTQTGTQHIGIYEFHADYVTPASSTFNKKPNLNVTAFQYYTYPPTGVPQLGSTRQLDPLGDRLMNRVQYRVFNGYVSMLVNHTVKTNTGAAGVRWYELQKTTGAWSIYQQSTYAPADARYRWMGSMAQDTAGNIALGFSISNSAMYPSVAYTGRLKNDPLNQMTIQERRIVNGGGSQTGIWDGRSRWGDYSSMRVDPSNPTAFWYTQEYYETTSDANWATRIASFSFENVFSSYTTAYPIKFCIGGSSQLKAFAFGGSGTYTYSWTSNPAGFTSDLQNPPVSPDTTTTYYVTISDGTQTRNDSTRVFVQLRQTVFAGNDTLVNKFVPSVALNGTATNYRLIGWLSSGDGSFSNSSSLITDYFPGNGDRNSGSVDLTLVALPVVPCTGNVMSTMQVTFDQFVALSEPGKNVLTMVLQPNPARSNVSIVISGTQNQDAHISLTDITGKIVYSENLALSLNKTTRNLDLSNYPKGVYVVQLKTNDQVKTERLIVQ